MILAEGDAYPFDWIHDPAKLRAVQTYAVKATANKRHFMKIRVRMFLPHLLALIILRFPNLSGQMNVLNLCVSVYLIEDQICS